MKYWSETSLPQTETTCNDRLSFFKQVARCHRMIKIDQASAMASREHYHSNAKANSWSSDALRMRFESCKSTPTKVTFVIYLSFNATNISRIKRTNVPVFCKSLRPSFRYGNEKVFVNPDSHSFRLAAYRQKSTERNVPFVASKQIQNSIQWWFVIHIFMLDYRWIVRNVQDLIFSSLTWFLSDGIN